MALAWTMDKIGPMCRSVEDCALVLNAIYGADGRDGIRTLLRQGAEAGFIDTATVDLVGD